MSTASPTAETISMNPKTDLRLIAIFLVVLIDVLGMTIMLPLLPFYSEHFGASEIVVGLLVSVYALCQLVSGPILGSWSDRFGRKKVLILSQIGTLIGFLILGFARSLVWIFISRIIDGLTAGNLSTAQAYISDISSPKDRAKSLGKISVAFGIGFFVGPALTAFLFHYGYQAPIFAAAGLSFTSILASYFLLPKHSTNNEDLATPTTVSTSDPLQRQIPSQTKEPNENEKKGFIPTFLNYIKNPQLAILFVEVFLFYFSFSTYMSGFALFSERRFTYNGIPLTPNQVGYAFTYFGFLGIIIQAFIIGRLVEKWGERKVALYGFVSSFIGYALLAFATEPFMLIVTGIFTSFGAGVLRPVLMSQIAGQVKPHERGKVLGVNQSLQSLAQIIAPVISTSIIGSHFIGAWALVPSLICLIAAWLITSRG